MYSWLIVGGGPQGVIIANALRTVVGLPIAELAIVDAHSVPLAVWDRRTEACGMRFLRSPGAHGLMPDFGALWAGDCTGLSRAHHEIEPYARPSLELFRHHAHVATAGLDECWVQGKVVDIREGPEGSYTTATADGRTFQSKRVVLALGAGITPRIPVWARQLESPSRASLIDHLFSDSFRRTEIRGERVAIIGGGISAVQLALSLSDAGGLPPVLLSRRPLRESQFDSDPCYIGPRCMEEYAAAPRPVRRALLESARHPGTVTPGLHQRLLDAVRDGAIIHRVESIQSAMVIDGEIHLSTQSGTVRADRIVLATGFEPARPAGSLIDRIADSFSGPQLPKDTDGYPVVREDLSWREGLYVTGKLAEVELGPSAANLIGAHNAAKRIISSLRGAPQIVPQAWRRYAPARVSSSSESI